MHVTEPEALERLRVASQLKEEGNALFRSGDFKGAFTRYTKIFPYTDDLILPRELAETLAGMYTKNPTPIVAETAQRVQEMRIVANLNCAMCCLRQGVFDRALHYCNRALKINDKHAKAIYRRGQICLALNDLDAAERDLVAAQQSFPKDAGVQSDLATLKHKMKQSEQRQRQQFAGMFDSATKQTPHPAVEERPSASSDA